MMLLIMSLNFVFVTEVMNFFLLEQAHIQMSRLMIRSNEWRRSLKVLKENQESPMIFLPASVIALKRCVAVLI